MKKAEYQGWVLFTSRSIDGRWWGWILNDTHDYVFCGQIPESTATGREAQQFVWQVAQERRGVRAPGEPKWIDIPVS